MPCSAPRGAASLYYLNALVQTGEPPEDWVDRNIATDYDKLETIADIQRRMDPERAEDALPPEMELSRGFCDFCLVPER